MSRDPQSRSTGAGAGAEAGGVECACDGLRCACGCLLARYVAGAIELKCRRCKRTVLVPIEAVTSD